MAANMRAIKARHDARTVRFALVYAQYARFGEQCSFDDDDDFELSDGMCTCCSGTGGDPSNDGITPCPECDGEGYAWWR